MKLIYYLLAGILLLIISSVTATACPVTEGGYYVGFSVMEPNYNRIPGFLWWDQVENATVTVTPENATPPSWILEMMGFDQSETVDRISDLPALSKVTDRNGFVWFPMYKAVRYNITINRVDKMDNLFVVYLRENHYHIYLRD
jgi:hypothetical protein